ncbi:MAG: carboxypeptidase regulatory-like domain-containing protein [Saprospiraceae bacterium]|nr:carboxypeptidase regulatory-like domain-containing protein [Saprospiraceae bacterium]
MAAPRFNCSQAVFVVVATTILDSMEEFLATFTLFKGKYILAWITARRAELAAAEAMPDAAARKEQSETLRVSLVNQVAALCALWQNLKSYITDAFAADVLDIKLNAAGHARYKAAASKNWTEAKAMFLSANNFMTANLATLTAGGNMPAGFPATFDTARTTFNTTLADYESSVESEQVATQDKTDAFNAVYDLISPMTKDGQKLYRNNEAVRTQFVISHVIARISGPGLAGARGLVLDITDSQPITGATATLTLITVDEVATVYTATTDDGGNYVRNCPSGNYNLQFTAPGFQPSPVKVITIEVGTVSTFNEKLTPEA